MAAVAADRRVDRAAARRRATFDERRVLAGDVAALELVSQVTVGGLGPGDDEQPRRVLVETVDDARPVGVAARGLPGQRLGERALLMAPARVHDESRRLVDDQQLVVLVGNRDVGRVDRLRHGDRGLVDLDRVAGRQLVALGHDRPVDGHRAGVDQARGAGPAAERRREVGVERAGPRARGQRSGARRSRTKIRTMTPNVIATSATLKAGQCGNLTKSVTAPLATRSAALPSAPPISRPTASHASGRVALRAK